MPRSKQLIHAFKITLPVTTGSFKVVVMTENPIWYVPKSIQDE
jgi:hypothetical protein